MTLNVLVGKKRSLGVLSDPCDVGGLILVVDRPALDIWEAIAVIDTTNLLC